MAAKILVVDDDPNVQRLLQYTLKQEGYEVIIAADGAEGFRLWGAEAPDLILLDVLLPKLDGYEVATKIRTEEAELPHVPIIMLTAEREVEQKVRGPQGRCRRLPDQAVPPGRAAGPDQEPARPVRAEGRAARPAADRPDPRLLRRQGRRRDDDDRDQRRDRAPPRARPEGLPGRRQPPVRRPPRLPRPRSRPQEHRRRRDGAVDRRRPHPPVMVKHDSGVDLLLAPPSPETAELVRPEHLPLIAEQLRSLYDYVAHRHRQAPRRRQPRGLRGGGDRSSWS